MHQYLGWPSTKFHRPPCIRRRWRCFSASLQVVASRLPTERPNCPCLSLAVFQHVCCSLLSCPFCPSVGKDSPVKRNVSVDPARGTYFGVPPRRCCLRYTGPLRISMFPLRPENVILFALNNRYEEK